MLHFPHRPCCPRLAATAFASSLLLRVQLHYELALCELTADFVVKAAEQLTNGLQLDYGRYDKETDEVLTGLCAVCVVCAGLGGEGVGLEAGT
jgi:hypothetical protein